MLLKKLKSQRSKWKVWNRALCLEGKRFFQLTYKCTIRKILNSL
jgi:hypothetical protein